MRYVLDVPFKLGQAVFQAVYSYRNDRGEQTNIITDWIVMGYKLDEFGHLFCICQRIQDDLKRIEHLDPKRLFSTKAEAEEFLDEENN